MVDGEHFKYLKKLDHDYSMRGDIEHIGRIKTTSFQSQNSKIITTEKRKKHDRALQQLLNYQDALRRFDEILAQLEERIYELEQLQLQSSQAWELITNNDTNGSIEFLIKYHNLDPNDLAVMSHDEIMAVMLNLERHNRDSIEDLKSDIEDLAYEAYQIMGKHFDSDNPQHQELMSRLEAMENRAQNLNTDFETIIEDVHVKARGQFSILEMKMEHSEIREDRSALNISNTHSTSDQSLSKQHEQELKTSNTTIKKPIGMNL